MVKPKPPEAALLPKGRGNYQILGEIARGGMGVVLKGHDADLGRDVALKVPHGELADRPEILQRFVEEAQIGGQLQHPGIVPVHELGLDADDRVYFSMKLVKGRNLADVLRLARALPHGEGAGAAEERAADSAAGPELRPAGRSRAASSAPVTAA